MKPPVADRFDREMLSLGATPPAIDGLPISLPDLGAGD